MEENVVFKTAAVGGFEKKAVLDYIYETSERYSQEKESLLQQISELENINRAHDEKVQALNDKVNTAEGKLSDVSSELASGTDEQEELRDKMQGLLAEVDRLKEQLKERDAQFQEYEEKSRVSADRNKELEAQREEIEKASYQLGRVMLDARADADIIVSNAQEQAKTIVSDAEKEADVFYIKAEQETNEILDKAKSEVDSMISSAEEKAKMEIAAAKTDAERTISDADLLATTTVSTADSKAAEALSAAKDRVVEISDSTKHVTDESSVQLRDLRRETLAVRQAIQEIYITLQEKSDILDSTIEHALEVLDKQDISSASENLLEMPQLELSDVLERVEAQKEEIRKEILATENIEYVKPEEQYQELDTNVDLDIEVDTDIDVGVDLQSELEEDSITDLEEESTTDVEATYIDIEIPEEPETEEANFEEDIAKEVMDEQETTEEIEIKTEHVVYDREETHEGDDCDDCDDDCDYSGDIEIEIITEDDLGLEIKIDEVNEAVLEDTFALEREEESVQLELGEDKEDEVYMTGAFIEEDLVGTESGLIEKEFDFIPISDKEDESEDVLLPGLSNPNANENDDETKAKDPNSDEDTAAKGGFF